ncbi:hypothetical protein WR25_19148 isoform B [Diploscapter pachys]|uniref:Uncharacterized protein n=1 Tax=Diploscapter pachys TaxID=2018661 RepID=A0A2A2JCJ4_9BILA|nr:hypothetical protein WR25_19148 isoform B [Diploscapter pachys]
MMGDNSAVSVSAMSVHQEPLLSEAIRDHLTKSGIHILTHIVNLETKLSVYEAQIADLQQQLEQAKLALAQRFELPKSPLPRMEDVKGEVPVQNKPLLNLTEEKKTDTATETVTVTPTADAQTNPMEEQELHQMIDEEMKKEDQRETIIVKAKEEDEKSQKSDSTVSSIQGLANGSKLKEVWTNKTRDQNCTGFAKQPPNIITIKPSLAPSQTEVRSMITKSCITSVPISTVTVPLSSTTPASVPHMEPQTIPQAQTPGQTGQQVVGNGTGSGMSEMQYNHTKTRGGAGSESIKTINQLNELTKLQEFLMI